MESASLLSHTYPLTQGQQQRQHLPLVSQPGQPAPGNYDQQQSGGQPAIAMLQPANVVDSNSTTTSIVGQKRNFLGNTVNSNAPDAQDGGNFVKLFVGSIPRTISEEEVQPMFAEHGNILEVALIKDKRTGQQQDDSTGDDFGFENSSETRSSRI